MGSALVFVLASAMVAFRGWPHAKRRRPGADRAERPGGARAPGSPAVWSPLPPLRALVAPTPCAVLRRRSRRARPAPRRAGQSPHRIGHGAPGIGRTGIPPRTGPPTAGPTRPPGTTPGPPASTPKPPTTTTPTANGGSVGTVVKKVGGTVSGTGSGWRHDHQGHRDAGRHDRGSADLRRRSGPPCQKVTQTVGGHRLEHGLRRGRHRQAGHRHRRQRPRRLSRSRRRHWSALPRRPSARSMNRRLTACSSGSCWTER